MSATVLVGYDPRARDHAPIDFGVTVAELTGARLIVASVQARMPALPSLAAAPMVDGAGQMDEDLVLDCSEALAEVEPELRTHGIAYECRRLEGHSAAQALQEAAQAERVALLVVGTGRHPLLGSTAQRLLHGAPCPVAAVPHDRRTEALRTIAVAMAGADSDHEVLAAAHALAVRAGARLRVITVVHVTPAMYAWTEPGTPIRPARDIDDIEGEYRALAERTLRRAVAGLGDEVPVEVDAFVGDPGEVLVELSEHLDLLVCGSRGYGPVRAVLLGSVSRRLAAEAHCPVLVLPRGVSAPVDALLAGQAAMA
jgi:nucleotide-binding universal stress UspA family protein